MDGYIRPLRARLAKDLKVEAARRPACYRHDDARLELAAIFLIHPVKNSFIDETVEVVREGRGEGVVGHFFVSFVGL